MFLGSFGALDVDRFVEGWRLETDVERCSLMNPENMPVAGKLASFLATGFFFFFFFFNFPIRYIIYP